MPVLEPSGAYRPPSARSQQPVSRGGTEDARSSSARRFASGTFDRSDASRVYGTVNSLGGAASNVQPTLRQASADRSSQGGGGGGGTQQTYYGGGGGGGTSSREPPAVGGAGGSGGGGGGGEMAGGRSLFSGGGGGGADPNSRPPIIAHPPTSPSSSNRRENIQRNSPSSLSSSPLLPSSAPIVLHHSAPPCATSSPSPGRPSSHLLSTSGGDYGARPQAYNSGLQSSSFSSPSSSPLVAPTPVGHPSYLGGGSGGKTSEVGGGGGARADDKKPPPESDGWGDDDDGFGGVVSMLDISQIQQKNVTTNGRKVSTSIISQIQQKAEDTSTSSPSLPGPPQSLEGMKEYGGGACDKSTLSMCSDLSTSSPSDVSTNPTSALSPTPSPPPAAAAAVASPQPSAPPPRAAATTTNNNPCPSTNSSAATNLTPSEPWRLRRGGDPREVFQRKAQCLLNKLTIENFSRITQQLGELTAELRGEAEVRLMVDLVLDKACLEPDWSEMYADVCQVLKWRSAIQQSRGMAVPPPADAAAARRPWFGTALVEKIREELSRLPTSLTLPSEQTVDLSKEEVALKTKKLKTRTMGVVKLIGELFYRKMLSGKTLNLLATHLVFSAEYPEDHFVEFLCNLASTVGYYMDETGGSSKLQLDTWMGRLMELQKSKKYSKRVCCVIQDLGDCRKAKWYKKTHKESAKALGDLHDQLGREEDVGGSVIAAQFGNVVVMGSRANIQAKGSYGQYMVEQERRYNVEMTGIATATTTAK
eukprot:GHVS01022199.1.p1 GENE.GHVS01022199.1~~GHVS01022199.1.p1  ORF type:complete len:796 (-),score=211.80 GHVS01022199.1:263-2539(-)